MLLLTLQSYRFFFSFPILSLKLVYGCRLVTGVTQVTGVQSKYLVLWAPHKTCDGGIKHFHHRLQNSSESRPNFQLSLIFSEKIFGRKKRPKMTFRLKNCNPIASFLLQITSFSRVSSISHASNFCAKQSIVKWYKIIPCSKKKTVRTLL